MYVSQLIIEGYKNCKNRSIINFNKGLNILVGENASGKTTIVNALRLILRENEYSYSNINESDFYKSFQNNKISEMIKLDLHFHDLTEIEEITFFSWCDADFNAALHLEASNRPNQKGYYKKTIWGGASKASVFEEETFECIDCVYLPPLRDAEEKLTNGRKSRLATLLKHQYNSEDDVNKFIDKVNSFNQSIVDNKDDEFKEIAKAKLDINNSLEKSMGQVFGQSINLQFSDMSFNSILQSIKMVFFPHLGEHETEKFRDIAINSLGYNNLLYIATVFAELHAVGKDSNLFTVLLIEEPEAHLHPQLQIKLIKYLEQLTLECKNMQIFITTHSPVLASSVSIDNLIHTSEHNSSIRAIQLSELGLGQSKHFINRWLDATKSTLLFSKGVILVEGISENLLLPEIAKYVLHKYNSTKLKEKLPETLEEAGVSVININGINFKHFMKLFCNIDESQSMIKLPIKCSGVTDNDPGKIEVIAKNKDGTDIKKKEECYPEIGSNPSGDNSALELINLINSSENARLFSSPLKTFEYDLAMASNLKVMAEVINKIWSKEGSVKKRLDEIINRSSVSDNKLIRDDSIYIFNHIEDDEVGKGIFAQELADKLSNLWANREKEHDISSLFKVPKYLNDAIIWACGGDIDE